SDSKERLQALHRVLHSAMDMLAHCFCRLIWPPDEENLCKLLMPPNRGMLRLFASDAVPRRRERMRFFYRQAQRRTVRAVRNPAMQFLMRRQVERLFR